MITLATLESLGCYVIAGHLDHYNGRVHTRLGDITADGDMLLDTAGEVYANQLHAESEAPAVEPEVPAVEPEAPVVEPSTATQELAHLMS